MQPFLSPKDASAILENDRRRTPREAVDPPRLIYLLARPQLERIEALLYDFSVRGMGFVTDRTFEVGAILAVQTQRRQVGLSGMLSAHVRHRRQLPSGKWFIGCNLSRDLTDEEQCTLRTE
jgi:PilZ domain